MQENEAEIADAILAAAAARRSLAPHEGLTLAGAYRVAAGVREARERRGERVAGRKIGFTNRRIWDEYGVRAPISGYVYEGTLHELGEAARAGDFAEPRIEPEIVFGLATPLLAGMEAREIAAAVAWVAHGFEIVQSLYPGWRFSAADAVAAFGLHGGLWVGPRRPLREGDAEALERFEITLSRNGAAVERGRAADVLGGPLHALRHLADTLGPDALPLGAGEIVTTGTLTRALPVAPGEVWTTALEGLDLPGARLEVR